MAEKIIVNGEQSAEINAGIIKTADSADNYYSSYRWLILCTGFLVLVLYMANGMLYIPLFGEIAKDLKVGVDACLNLSMAFVIIVAFGVCFGGILVDKYSLTKIYTVSILCSVIPSVLMPWIGHNYGIVFASRLVQGVASISFSTIGPIVALWFPPRERGLAGGILLSTVPLGTALALLVMPAILGAAGTWQKAVAFSTIPNWIILVPVIFVVGKRPSQAFVEELSKEVVQLKLKAATYLQALSWPVTWVGVMLFFCNSWASYTIYNVVPPYLAMLELVQ